MNRMLIFNMLATIDKLTEHKRSTGWNGFIQVVEKMERETGFEPATSSLGIQTYVGSKSLARFCCEFLNLQRLAESAFSGFDRLNEAQTRHVLHTKGPTFHLDDAPLIKTGKPFWPTRSLIPTLDTFRTFVSQSGPRANLRIPCVPNHIDLGKAFHPGRAHLGHISNTPRIQPGYLSSHIQECTGTNELKANPMANDSRFKLGQSGNPQSTFKAGNRYRWQPGQSGNPAGIARSRLRFEECFYASLIEQGAAEEAAPLLWGCARKREPWAVQALLQRLAPETKQIKLTHGVDDEPTVDYTRLTDEELDHLERLLERAKTPDGTTENGEG